MKVFILRSVLTLSIVFFVISIYMMISITIEKESTNDLQYQTVFSLNERLNSLIDKEVYVFSKNFYLTNDGITLIDNHAMYYVVCPIQKKIEKDLIIISGIARKELNKIILEDCKIIS